KTPGDVGANQTILQLEIPKVERLEESVSHGGFLRSERADVFDEGAFVGIAERAAEGVAAVDDEVGGKIIAEEDAGQAAAANDPADESGEEVIVAEELQFGRVDVGEETDGRAFFYLELVAAFQGDSAVFAG